MNHLRMGQGRPIIMQKNFSARYNIILVVSDYCTRAIIRYHQEFGSKYIPVHFNKTDILRMN